MAVEVRSQLTRPGRRAALLAAVGLSDREIAGGLVVFVRAVGSHLQRACGKPGVSGRKELAVAWRS
jgi:DNA-binding CsgD family transcriptional regulator